MPRYIEGNEIKLTPNDVIFVDAEFDNGENFTELELHRLFPITNLNKYIALMDRQGNEIAVIRDIETLSSESKQVAEDCLREYYMIPRITKFLKMSDRFLIWMWTAQTDKGVYTFEIRNHITAVKPLYDGRVLIKDANDNRYEIPDVNKLDSKSRKLILPKL